MSEKDERRPGKSGAASESIASRHDSSRSPVEQATAKNPFRSLLTVINNTRTVSVQIPTEGLAPTRAQVVAEGSTKNNLNFVLTNYSATLYTLAQLFDVSNQLLRHSAGAAEQLVRSKLARGWALGGRTTSSTGRAARSQRA